MNEIWWPSRVHAGEVVYPPGGTWGPRRQGDYQLVLLHTGCLDLKVDNECRHYPAGVVLLLTPGHTEFFQFATDSLTHHSWISVHGPALPDSWVQKFGEHQARAIPLSPHMHNLAKEAIHWIHCKHTDQLLLSIGYHALHLFFAEAMETSTYTGRHSAVQLVEQFINIHYNEDLCLKDLCKQAAVSPEYLCRLFGAYYGTSPMVYLWRYRTKRALNLLSTTGLSIADIAERCGFKTPFHLHHRVKALTGLSPSQYRKQCWAGSQPALLQDGNGC